MLEQLFNHVATGLSLTKGVTIHYGHIPQAEPALCTGILERVGIPTDPYNKHYKQFRYQLLTRGPSYKTAETEARRVYEFTQRLRGVQLSGWYLYDVMGVEPAYIGQDEKKRFQFSANVTVACRKE